MGAISLNIGELERWNQRSKQQPPSYEPVDYDTIAREFGGTPAETTDYDAIARELGGTPQATPEERRTLLGFLGNAAKSYGGLIRGVADPTISVPGMTSLFAGMAEKSGFKPLPGNPLAAPNYSLWDKDILNKIPSPLTGNAVDALVDHYKQRYGSWEGFTKAAYEDPAGIMLDAAMILEPGAAGLKLAGLARTAAVVGRAGQIVNPLRQVAAVAKPIAKPALTAIDRAMEATARRMRQSSLRGGYNITTPHEQVAGATAAMRGVPLTEEGLSRISAEERALQQQKMEKLAQAELRGATTDRNVLVRQLEDIRRKYQQQPLPGRDVKQVDKAIQEVLETYPEQIPVMRAEGIKEGLTWKEGLPPELQALAASEKGIAEAIRRDLVEWVPELADINKRQQSRIWLKGMMESAINKRLNSGGFWERLLTQRALTAGSIAGVSTGLLSGGLYGTIGGLTGALGAAILSDPVIQSRLAVAINKAQQYNPAKFGRPSMRTATARAGKVAQDARIPIERRLPAGRDDGGGSIVTPPPADTSFVRAVPGQYPPVERPQRLALPPAPEIRVPPAPADTSFVRAVPGEYPEVIPPLLRNLPPEEPPPTPPAAPPPARQQQPVSESPPAAAAEVPPELPAAPAPPTETARAQVAFEQAKGEAAVRPSEADVAASIRNLPPEQAQERFRQLVAEMRQTPGVDVNAMMRGELPSRYPGWAGDIPTSEISVDPVRFQFKRDVGKGGAGEKLKNVTVWDPNKGGTILVWKDPASGRTYVINGHHRIELAQRLAVPDVHVRFLTAKDASEARLQGAIANISEDSGSVLDAAKVVRESGLTLEQLRASGLALEGKVARPAVAIANLSPTLFSAVLSGDLAESRAALIGTLQKHPDQHAVFKLIQQGEKRGRTMTDKQVAELIRMNERAGTVTESTAGQAQGGLFGDEDITRSLLLEKAQVSDYVREQLRAEKRLFGAVSSQAAAERLERTGNVIRAEENLQVAERANQGTALYDKLSTAAGPIDDALNEAAEALAKGQTANAVFKRAYQRIRDELEQQLRRLTGGP